MFDVYKLSEEENRLVKIAKERDGSLFDNAYNTLKFSWVFVDKFQPDAWIFQSFFTQHRVSMQLAFLSILRLHSIQAEMNIRQALEAIVLACYSLGNPKVNEFIYFDNDGILHEKPKLKNKAYRWFDEKYPDHSKKIKTYKDNINTLYAHSNLIIAFMNSEHDFDEGKMYSSFFENTKDYQIKVGLWMIANMNLGFTDLIIQALNDHPIANIMSGYKDKLKGYWGLNNQHKKMIKTDERFPSSIRERIII